MTYMAKGECCSPIYNKEMCCKLGALRNALFFSPIATYWLPHNSAVLLSLHGARSIEPIYCIHQKQNSTAVHVLCSSEKPALIGIIGLVCLVSMLVCADLNTSNLLGVPFVVLK